MEFSQELLLLLFCIAMVAGWVDVIAGGGGLITVPLLILTGMHPAVALATNKLQASVGTFIASLYFVKKGLIDLGAMRYTIMLTFLGSIVGSWFVLKIDASHLLNYIPILLIATGFYFLVSPNLGDYDARKRIGMGFFALSICPLLGFYDGLLGPGTGSFMSLAFVILLGYSLSRATANAKILNFTSNVSALGYFLVFGQVEWAAGLVMILGQSIGAIVGAKMVFRHGARLVKPIVVLVCFLMSISILYRTS